MSKELVIGSNRHETKVAVLEDDQLVEIYFQRANEYSLAGSIHKGRVTRVLPGMQSAFVDLGLERDTFLYVSDFFDELNGEEIDAVEEKPVRGRDNERRDDRRDNERRDRGGRPNQERQERPVQDRPAIVEVISAPVIQEPEEVAPVAQASPTLAGETREQPSGQQSRPPAGNDRNDRGGDRRNRRSRRRRGRGGRGIPDNKYAQPGVGSTEPATGFVESEPEEVEVEREEASADVIMLPGESLAKYRNRPDEPVSTTPTPVAEVTEPEDEIEEEAESLILSDQVFSHQPPSPTIVEEVAAAKAAEIPVTAAETPVVEEKVVEIHHEPLEDISWSPERRAAEELFSRVVPIDEEEGEEEEEEEDEDPLHSHLSAAEAFEAEVEEFDSTGSIASVHDLAPEVEEALEAGDFEATPPETTNDPTAQTASLREQGGRYPHRSSRRMRRRRGGNRFGNENPNPAGNPAAPAASQPGPVEERITERPDRSDRPMPSISDLLKPGQEIIVQIAKEPLGQKGARITSHIALPGRYVVFMPSVNHLGVSRKVSSDEERQRLKRILQAHRVGTTGGFIVRTAGEGVPEDEIAADMNFLYTLWLDIRQKAEKKPAPALLHYDLDVVQRILRDQLTEDFKAIWVDNEDLYENVVTFMQRFQPSLVTRVKMYTRSAPIFDSFNITQELEKALRPKVWLKSGGYLVINQTEALVAIDINTGKYVGRSNRLEDTIVKTNTEAVKEIVRQIRLRDLGGIIVVDFIDMDERKNRQKVMQALEEAMRSDKAPYKILQFNDFGLVAITRKRVKQSLERTLCAPCHYCDGAGYVKSTQTIIGEILIEAQKLSKAIEGKDVLLRVHPAVAKVLKASDNKYLEELEEILHRPVLVKGDESLHSEKFDLG